MDETRKSKYIVHQEMAKVSETPITAEEPILFMESVKRIGESLNLEVPLDVVKHVAEDVSYQLKKIMSAAEKCMHHSKRTTLLTTDIKCALSIFNFGLPKGITESNSVHLCHDILLEDDDEKVVNMLALNLDSSTAILPLEPSLRKNWVYVNRGESTDQTKGTVSTTKLSTDLVKTSKKNDNEKPPNIIDINDTKSAKTVSLARTLVDELPVEEIRYFLEISESCISSNEFKRNLALKSLATSTGLHDIIPRLCVYIMEGVKINILDKNLHILYYLMKMLESILKNPDISIQKYLHEIIPAVSTCIVSKELCNKPELENHWALRDFSAKIMGYMCKQYSTPINNLQTRMTRVYYKGLLNRDLGANCVYGSIVGLSELGNDVVNTFILPHLSILGNRIELEWVHENASYINKIAGSHIRAKLLKYCAPLIKSSKPEMKTIFDFRVNYGYLGDPLYHQIKALPQTKNINWTSLKRKEACETVNPATTSTTGNLSAQVEGKRKLVPQIPLSTNKQRILSSNQLTTLKQPQIIQKLQSILKPKQGEQAQLNKQINRNTPSPTTIITSPKDHSQIEPPKKIRAIIRIKQNP